LAAAPAGTPTSVTVASDTPVDEMTEAELRAAIADILATHDGKGVVREANKALNGTVEDMRAFLTTGFQQALFEDDLVAIGTILGRATRAGDRAVIEACNEVLNTRTPESARAFLETGYARVQFEDDLVAVARALHQARLNNDKAVIELANATLDAYTPESARAFRETGYRLAQAEDDAVYIATMLGDPDISPAMRAAINAVLDDGSPEALRYFRLTGQYEVEG
ncbi:ALF repeat-containing protein, partial [Streptomyces hainanensis]